MKKTLSSRVRDAYVADVTATPARIALSIEALTGKRPKRESVARILRYVRKEAKSLRVETTGQGTLRQWKREAQSLSFFDRTLLAITLATVVFLMVSAYLQ